MSEFVGRRELLVELPPATFIRCLCSLCAFYSKHFFDDVVTRSFQRHLQLLSMHRSAGTLMHALTCLLLAVAPSADAFIEQAQPTDSQSRFLNAFPLSSVQLEPDSPAGRAQALNAQYLRMIDPDSLLWTFRKNAGLPHTKGLPYYGSWEDPGVEVFLLCRCMTHDASSNSGDIVIHLAWQSVSNELCEYHCAGSGRIHRSGRWIAQRSGTMCMSQATLDGLHEMFTMLKHPVISW